VEQRTVPSAAIAASVLNADFGRLAEQVAEVEAAGVDSIHVDVMDGHFVPNISLGFGIIEAIRRSTRLPIDLHLMIDQPERYLERFVATGANLVTVHCEAARHLHRALTELRTLGAQAGLALAPATPLTMVEEVLANIDLLLVMTINPGFGGQALIPTTIDKVRRARALLDAQRSAATLQVDGGVKSHNAAALTRAGATCLVVGTGIFEAPGGIQTGVMELRQAIEGA
jgi:ribulose-phosphate 3-epimerase